MTIRTKLLLFIPLLVLLVNSVTFFLFQSGRLVQQSYNQMMDRLLLYNQSIQTVERNLGALHTYLLNPDESNHELLVGSMNKLKELRVKLQAHSDASLHSAKLTSYNHMMDTFIEQEEAAFEAVSAETLLTSLSYYEKAEKTAGFIREDEQQLVDQELSIYQPVYKQVLAENKTMYLLGAAVFIMNTVMSILLAVWISRSITVPVSRLVSRVKQISKGELQHNTLTYPAKDELGLLAGAFEQMSGDLLVMMEKDKQSLEKDRLVKALELQALQSQINPHFLFNTLNVLSKLSLLEGAEKTSDLIISMSNLLRYNLRNLTHPVTLEDEVRHVKEYFIIQQARFRDRITLEMDIDPMSLKQPIPALTLQPLVENAFLHGIERMEKDAVIRLEIKNDAEGIFISVSDNGHGMSEEVRQALLRLEAGTENKQSAGLGTKNVFRRLQLFYGVSGLVNIESKLGEGTKVIIRIPPGKEVEDHHVPTVNRG